MIPLRIARVLVRLLALIVLLASGIYLLVYLYRWEWNRALISGLFFVAAEVALAAALITRRLARLERRIEEIGEADAASSRAAREEPSPVAPVFRWLEPGSLGVFVPVLLGVGVILSTLAYLVERLAAATTRGIGGATIDRLAPLAPPPPTGSGTRAPSHVGAGAAAPVRLTEHTAAGWVLSLVIAAFLIASTVVLLSDLTRYRVDPTAASGTTTYTLLVETRDGTVQPEAVVQTLWLSCRSNLAPGTVLQGLSLDERGTVALVVRPAVGENADRRFAGCMEDVQLDRVRVGIQHGRTR